MNETEFDRAARAWLDDGPTQISYGALSSALEEIHRTRQRRATWRARRATPMSSFAHVGIAAVLGVAVGVAATNVVQNQLDWRVGDPSSSAAQSVDFPHLTRTFVSPRNGFSVDYPDAAEITRAEQLWGFSQQDDDGFDVVETGLAAVFKGTSAQPLDADLCYDDESEPIPCESIEERLDRLLSDGGCGVPRSQQEEITIDGHSGRVAECPNQIEATVFTGGQFYLFTLSHDRSDGRAVFNAFVGTIELNPRAAVDSPPLTKTFVSPTYGFSFGYNRGISPATERWDPDDQPVDHIDFDPRFDAVETGNAAYFEAASTPIPDGVPIDEWVDEYVTPEAAGGCGIPRSEQAEINIDGQPGRISECAHTEATVVAGGRLYLFRLHRLGYARDIFDAWVATIELTPETATTP
jgi:hypothetical protein